jgi:type IV pilus assembly protein PilQ
MNGSHVAKAMTATGLRRTLALVGALLLYALAGGAQALTVTDIEFSSRPGSKFEVRLDFDDVPPAELQSYTIEKPARIAIDFPGTKSPLDASATPFPTATPRVCWCSNPVIARA